MTAAAATDAEPAAASRRSGRAPGSPGGSMLLPSPQPDQRGQRRDGMRLISCRTYIRFYIAPSALVLRSEDGGLAGGRRGVPAYIPRRAVACGSGGGDGCGSLLEMRACAGSISQREHSEASRVRGIGNA